MQCLHEEQVKVGFKFANKWSRGHFNISSHKIVRTAAQTLSNSVGDAIGYFMLSGHHLKNAEGTIEFTRKTDNLFYLLNLKNTLGEGWKQPLR